MCSTKGCEVIPRGWRKEQGEDTLPYVHDTEPLLLCWDITPFLFNESDIKAFPRIKRVESIWNPVPSNTTGRHPRPVVSSLTSATRRFSSCGSRWQGSSVLLVRWQVLVRHLQGIPWETGKPRQGEGKGLRGRLAVSYTQGYHLPQRPTRKCCISWIDLLRNNTKTTFVIHTWGGRI